MSSRLRAVLSVLGLMALGFLAMAAMLVVCCAIVAGQSPEFTTLDMTLSMWPFVVGCSSLTALGMIAGFSPDDLGPGLGYRD